MFDGMRGIVKCLRGLRMEENENIRNNLKSFNVIMTTSRYFHIRQSLASIARIPLPNEIRFAPANAEENKHFFP